MTSPSPASLAIYPVHVPLPVQWGDMDAYQHVNNVVYFRWFETARMALFRAVDFTSGVGIGPILHSTTCRYRAPVYFPDDIVAAARVIEVGDDRFTVEMAVSSAREEAIAATGTAVIVAYDYVRKTKATLPAAVRAAIAGLG